MHITARSNWRACHDTAYESAAIRAIVAPRLLKSSHFIPSSSKLALTLVSFLFLIAISFHIRLYSFTIKMAPKRNAAAKPPSDTASGARPVTPIAQPIVAAPLKAKINANKSLNPAEVAQSIWNKYVTTTPQRTKLIDVFMAFLVVVGVLQFVYCIIVGNYVSTTGWKGGTRAGLDESMGLIFGSLSTHS